MLVHHMKILHLRLSTENGNIHINEVLDVNFITIFSNYGFILKDTDIVDKQLLIVVLNCTGIYFIYSIRLT